MDLCSLSSISRAKLTINTQTPDTVHDGVFVTVFEPRYAGQSMRITEGRLHHPLRHGIENGNVHLPTGTAG